MDSQLSNPKELFKDPKALFDDFNYLHKQDEFRYDAKFDAYIITRYDDIITVLDDPATFSSRPTVPDPPPFIVEQIAQKCPMRGTLLGVDNPAHDRLKRSVSSFFIPRRLARFQATIEARAHELIDLFVETGQTDIKRAFALPLPLQIISLIVGLDPERWEWVGRSLALFGGHAAFAGGSLNDKISGILELHDYVKELIRIRKSDRKDDLISHIWNQRDNGEVEMTDFEHLSMIPGLLLAGHETTTNLLTMGLSHLLHNKLWHQVNTADAQRAACIEELVRYESAITGMKREVTRTIKLKNTTFHPGDQLFLAYNAGSRDSHIFASPAKLVMGRKFSKQHLGFGRGVHACLGAPLARLLLQSEMKVLYERLANLQLVTPYEDRKYDPVHEGRGIESLLVSWDAVKPPVQSRRTEDFASLAPQFTAGQQELLIERVRPIAEGVLEITMRAQNGASLPSWAPGAHIDLAVGSFGYRQYSLCGDPNDRTRFTVAVLRNIAGSGGSNFVHTGLVEGQKLFVRGPRNHFPLCIAKTYTFVAGGIGITPIKPMIQAVKASGGQYRLIYVGTTRPRMAYADDFVGDPCVDVWPSDERGRFNLSSLRLVDQKDSIVYCCGPARLLNAVETLFANAPSGRLHLERFENTTNLNVPNKPFEVVLQRSGKRIQIPSDRTLLEVVNENGAGIMSTCSKGTCGTCEVRVLEGVPEHRDTVLSSAEKDEGKTMMPCVSRCIGSRLVLDLW